MTTGLVRRTVAAALLSGLLGMAAHGAAAAKADAPSKEAKTEAKKLAKTADRAFAKGSFDAALADYQKAHDLVENWELLEKVGNTLAALRRYEEARAAYARVMDEAGVPAKKKKALAELVESLDLVLGTVLVVTSDPPGATLYLDTRVTGPVGKTPFRGNTPPGLKRIILECDRCKPYAKTVEVAAMTTTAHKALLELEGTPLVVEATPAGARVRVDGADGGPAPYRSALTTGKHVVMVEAEGYETLEREVVADGTSLRLVVTLRSKRD